MIQRAVLDEGGGGGCGLTQSSAFISIPARFIGARYLRLFEQWRILTHRALAPLRSAALIKLSYSQLLTWSDG